MADRGDVGKKDPSAGLFMMKSAFIYSEVNITQQIPVRSPDSCVVSFPKSLCLVLSAPVSPHTVPRSSWGNNRSSRQDTLKLRAYTHWTCHTKKLTWSLTQRSHVGGSSITLLDSSPNEADQLRGVIFRCGQPRGRATPTRPEGAQPTVPTHTHLPIHISMETGTAAQCSNHTYKIL